MALVTGSGRGLGTISIIDPAKTSSVGVNQTGAMFDKNGKPIGATEKKWTRPTQAANNSLGAQSDALLNNIKSGIEQKEEKSMGLVNLTSSGTFSKGVGNNQSSVMSAGTAIIPGVTPVQSSPVTTAPVIQAGTATTGTQVTQVQGSGIIKPGSKVQIAGATTATGTNIIQGGAQVVANGQVVGTATTADQKLANAKRNAGKLLNRILEMSYGLTEQEEKYLIEMMDAIGMKETLMAAAGHGTATPINTQVILNAINEMNQVMVTNTSLISNNVELANSLYGKLDNLTIEAQAGGYNESELINVLAELYVNGMINTNDTSKPNLIFCFNTFKTQIERLVGTVNQVQQQGVITSQRVAAPVIVGGASNQNSVIRTTTPIGTGQVTGTSTQTTGKLFVKPQQTITNSFNRNITTGGGVGIIRNNNQTLVPTSRYTAPAAGTGLITTANGSNQLRTPISVTGLNSSVGVRSTIQTSYDTEPNYSSRGGAMTQTSRGVGSFASAVSRPSIGAVGQTGSTPIRGSVTQVSAVQQSNPITAYMNM